MAASPTPTPTSEKSEYYDAPMHFFSSGKAAGASQAPAAPASPTTGPDPDPEQPLAGGSNTQADVARQPSVAIARDPVMSKQPTGDSGEQADTVKGQHAAEGSSAPAYEDGAGPPDGYIPDAKQAAPRSASPTTTSSPSQSVEQRGVNGVTGTTDGGSTFINGAATTGPAAEPELHNSVRLRGLLAEKGLTPKQKSKIVKQERKDGKQLSKVIKAEAEVEKVALGVVIKQLGELQQIQKDSVKRESKAHSAHTKALAVSQKAETAFLSARTAYERASAELAALEDALEKSRAHARESTERMAEKMREVERLRAMKATDERERGKKLRELSGE